VREGGYAFEEGHDPRRTVEPMTIIIIIIIIIMIMVMPLLSVQNTLSRDLMTTSFFNYLFNQQSEFTIIL
jgi:competence protein ComGC